jgi:uncharacterized protein (TIGR03435 family)
LLVAAAFIAAAAVALTMSPLRMVASPRVDALAAVQNIPKWDTVSIRRCTNPPVRAENGEVRGSAPAPGRLTLNCATLASLVQSSFAFADGHVDRIKAATTGLDRFPEWTRSERYTIEARAQGDPDVHMMAGPMLRRLLEDRFRLRVHQETREGKVYILSAPAGSKLETLQPGICMPVDYRASERASNPCPYTSQRDGNMGFNGWMSMESLATLLTVGTRNPQSPLDAPILDRTGLTDVYHVQVEYSPASHLPAAPPAESIFSALAKLGLKLEAGKGPRQLLVFDHAERPTEN